MDNWPAHPGLSIMFQMRDEWCVRGQSQKVIGGNEFLPIVEKVCPEIPMFRFTSLTGVPVSAWRRAKAIGDSVNLDLFMA